MEKVIMKSQKMNKNWIMTILWCSLAVLLAIFLVVMAFQYRTVKNAQDVVISGILAISDHYDDIKDDRSKVIARLYDNFTNGCSTGGYNSPLSLATTRVFQSLRDIANSLLDLAGYGNHSAATWLSYGSFSQYCLDVGLPFLIILFILTVMMGIASMLYLMDNKAELVIQQNTIIGKKCNGKTVQFLLKDIKSVETTRTRGLKITGAGIKYVIHSICNGDDMKNTIMCMLTEIPNEQAVVVMSDNSTSSIKEYKELLDLGIITQEEFDAKKKQLLGM